MIKRRRRTLAQYRNALIRAALDEAAPNVDELSFCTWTTTQLADLFDVSRPHAWKVAQRLIEIDAVEKIEQWEEFGEPNEYALSLSLMQSIEEEAGR
jgi:hypothetical protein